MAPHLSISSAHLSGPVDADLGLGTDRTPFSGTARRRIVCSAAVHISCGLAPSLDTVEEAKFAEDLGYERVWLYDSPAIYLDIWASLALVACHTERIGL